MRLSPIYGWHSVSYDRACLTKIHSSRLCLPYYENYQLFATIVILAGFHHNFMKTEEKTPLKISPKALKQIKRKGGHATIYAAMRPKVDG
jgi:hypothetical protein